MVKSIWRKTRNFVFWKIIFSKSVTEGKPNFNILAGKPCLFSVWALKGKSRFYKFNLKSFRLSFIIMKPYLYTLFILFIFCLRGRFPFLFWDFLVCFTMILQHIRIILGDTWFEPGNSASEVWCATNEPPHHPRATTSLLNYCDLFWPNIANPFHSLASLKLFFFFI